MLVFFIGSCLGSFLCLVAQRLPLKKSFLYSRSICDACQQPLRVWELIPIFSSLYLRFHCGRCHQPFSKLLWMAEITYGILTFFCWYYLTGSKQILGFIWLTILFLLSLTDLFYYLVEPKILYLGHSFVWLLNFYTKQPVYYSTILLFLLLGLCYLSYLKDKMGLGDLILLGCWAPWLTPIEFSSLLLLASTLGLVVLLLTKQKNQPLPFVPFLSIGFTIVYFIH
jgi:Type II secretory pathway, prepilin signal peptidase PulO and related peptidases